MDLIVDSIYTNNIYIRKERGTADKSSSASLLSRLSMKRTILETRGKSEKLGHLRHCHDKLMHASIAPLIDVVLQAAHLVRAIIAFRDEKTLLQR